ncbi:MAG: acylphosphatase [Gemmatimonadota bacterium]|nr:acylphosphatase [Gemmatimonadota bacterium]
MPDDASQQKRHIVVEGLVQGVGFRWFARERARRGGLSGWVQNRSDGSVEIRVSGVHETLSRFLAELAVGPKGAQVNAVRELETELMELLPFPFQIHR